MRLRKSHPLFKPINEAVIDLATPSSLTYLWNFGSLLGLCLIIQIVTGIFLAMHYCCHVELAFNSVQHIIRNVEYGWLLKHTHANGASAFFICVYIHIARGLYYGSYLKKEVWNVGIILLLLMMVTAFIGYVLPWGQMSFWGATVITNFVSAIPYIGQFVVEWIWGGFSIGQPTLNRFYSLHYLFPFILLFFVILHLLFLHQEGSNSPTGLSSACEKVPFHPYYTSKDFLGFCLLALGLSYLVFFKPYMLGDPENFIKANSLVTPVHIMPEWYFLFAYAILRAIPNKLGGVLALVGSILILCVLPYAHSSKVKSNQFKVFSQVVFWVFVANFIFLTWIGSKPVEAPYIVLGQISSVIYFLYFIVVHSLVGKIENFIVYEYGFFIKYWSTLYATFKSSLKYVKKIAYHWYLLNSYSNVPLIGRSVNKYKALKSKLQSNTKFIKIELFSVNWGLKCMIKMLRQNPSLLLAYIVRGKLRQGVNAALLERYISLPKLQQETFEQLKVLKLTEMAELLGIPKTYPAYVKLTKPNSLTILFLVLFSSWLVVFAIYCSCSLWYGQFL